MDDLRITLVQSELRWEDPIANLEFFSSKLNLLTDTDLIVLPETFTTGFSMNTKAIDEKKQQAAIDWMKQMAHDKNAVVTGSIMMDEEGRYYNRLLWVQPGGKVQHYNKRHLFTLTGEEKVFTPGNDKLIVHHKGWKICPLICYDLRFPVWSRNRINNSGEAEYDLLLYVANWPQRRSYAWKQLLVARAIENQCYVAAVNRVGNDGNDVYYSGDSLVIDPLGRVIFHAADSEVVQTVTISNQQLSEVRKQFSFLKDADDFQIGIKQKFKSH